MSDSESNGTTVVVHEGPVAVASTRPVRLLRPIAEPAQVIEAQNAARAMVHGALKEGRDFGKIPGAGDKPTMLKPGAERVALAFGCYYGEPRIIEKEVDHDRAVRWIKRKKVWYTERGDRKFRWDEESGESLGLYRYVIELPVINRETGETVGSGVGACSSMESKYVDRPRDSENTILKMAHKRAMVAACLVTFGLSDEFTQDVEDLPGFGAESGQSEQPRRASAKGPSNGGKGAAGSPPATGEAEPALATADQKRRIATLLNQADIDDGTRERVAERAGAATFTHTRAIECIAWLEKVSTVAAATAGHVVEKEDDSLPF